MTETIAAVLFILAMVDGSFAGFRSSAGRTGLISHRRSDCQAARRGAGLACALLAPVMAGVCADAITSPAHLDDYARTGTAMLAIYGPYALVVLIALACYATLSWQLRYLASALILGPLTLLRPAVAILGAALGAALSNDIVAAAAACLSVIAVLAVEPLAGRLWYTRTHGLPGQRGAELDGPALPAARIAAELGDLPRRHPNGSILGALTLAFSPAATVSTASAVAAATHERNYCRGQSGLPQDIGAGGIGRFGNAALLGTWIRHGEGWGDRAITHACPDCDVPEDSMPVGGQHVTAGRIV